MKVNEIWEFDNGSAYDLCRIVSEKPLTGMHNGGETYLICKDAEGWRKIGEATDPLTFTPRLPNVKTQT